MPAAALNSTKKDAGRNLRGWIMLYQDLTHRYIIRWQFGESLFRGVCVWTPLPSCGQELLNTALTQTVFGKCHCMHIMSVITVKSYRGIEVKKKKKKKEHKHQPSGTYSFKNPLVCLWWGQTVMLKTQRTHCSHQVNLVIYILYCNFPPVNSVTGGLSKYLHSRET